MTNYMHENFNRNTYCNGPTSTGIGRFRLSTGYSLLACLLAFTPRIQAVQNLSLAATVDVSAAATTGPIGSATDLRVEFRIMNYTAPGTGKQVIGQDGGWYITLSTGGNLVVDERRDTWPSGDGNTTLSLSGYTDFLVRIQRIVSTKTILVEVWDTATGSNYTSSTRTWTTTNPGWTMSNFAIYTPGTGAPYLSWCRIYSTTVAANSAVPRDSVSTSANIADWEFQGNLLDTSGNGYNLAGTGATYVTRTLLPPSCGISNTAAYRAGFTVGLSGSSQSQALNGNTTLTAFWTTTSGAATETWTSRTAIDPTVLFPIFGNYTVLLAVTDSSSNTTTCTANVGAVATDSQYSAVNALEYVYQILGPQIKWGSSPWPSLDERHQAMADLQGEFQDVGLLPYWETAQAGTVTFTNGSTAVTGSGTTFQTTFCNGGSTIVADSNPKITAWYRVGAGFGRRDYSVASCASQTSMTLYSNYEQPTADSSAIQYSASSDQPTYGGPFAGQAGLWFGNATNANFYDNVMAYYSLYYRSGITAYLNYARWLAGKWYASPGIDQGRVCFDGLGGQCLAARNRALAGLILYALEYDSSIWVGLRKQFDSTIASLTASRGLPFNVHDVRERGYEVSYLALCAILDPDATQAGECATSVGLERTYWAANDTNGVWYARANGFDTWNGAAGTAAVVNGSATITGSGTSWPAGQQASYNFWVSSTADGTAGDIRSYDLSAITSTSATLTTPYQGTTNPTVLYWQFNNITGLNVSPFIHGVPALAWWWDSLGAGSSALTVGISNWIRDNGVYAATRGLYYNVGSPSCYDPVMALHWCDSDGDDDAARTLTGEGLNSIVFGYLLSPVASTKSAGDDLIAALWGKDGGPDTDGSYNTLPYTAFQFGTNVAKYLGFYFGFGRGPSWPSARLGGVLPADTQTYAVSCNLPTAIYPTAAKQQVILRSPTGEETTTTSTCATPTMAVTVDKRVALNGVYTRKVQFLTSEDVVIASGEWQALRVQ